jgi:hypothetical protein
MSDAASISIVASDRKTQRAVQRILGVTGYPLDISDSVQQAIDLLAQRAPIVVVLDGAAATSPLAGELMSRAHQRGAAVTNLLVRPMPTLAEELITTVHKLIRRDVFGADKYLLWGTEMHEHAITRASQRSRFVSELADRLRGCGQSARVASMAMLVADELISNAVHNAPVDDHGVHFRKDMPRDIEIELAARETVRVRWGCDARYLAIEVSDQFGSLQRKTILSSLANTGARDDGAGAGMGIALCYGSCDHLVFTTSPGRRTEVIALIDVRYTPTERAPVSSYNVFEERAQ